MLLRKVHASFCVCVPVWYIRVYQTLYLPPVNFNVLAIEKENGSWSNGDVKVFSVDWYSITIYTVYVRHLGQQLFILHQLLS